MTIVLSLDTEMFVVYVMVLKIKIIIIDFLDKLIILIKIFNYTDIFLSEIIEKLLKCSNNDYIIKLEKSEQLLFGLIYSLGLTKLETFKSYIKINFTNSFIQL